MPEVDDTVLSAFLTPQKTQEICDALLRSPDPDARAIGMYIKDSVPEEYLQDDGRIEIAAEAAPGPKKVLDSAVRRATRGGRTIPQNTYAFHFQNVKNWGFALLKQFFLELRKKICGRSKTAGPLGQAANNALTTLGTAVAQFLHVTNALAMGVTVLLITNAAWIGKIALCAMTSPDQLAKYFGA